MTTEDPNEIHKDQPRLSREQVLAKLKEMRDLLHTIISDADASDPDVYQAMHFLAPYTIDDRIGEAIIACDPEGEDD